MFIEILQPKRVDYLHTHYIKYAAHVKDNTVVSKY